MKYVVIGASAAGINGAKRLRQLDKTAEITLISKDEIVYSRCILHHYIHGNRSASELDFTERNFFEVNQIEWIKGREVTKVDTEHQTLILDNDESVQFDKLLIASGANPFFPPVPKLREAKNIIGLRNFSDSEFIKQQAPKCKHIAIMGAGLVGMDALTGLLDYGKEMTIIDLEPHLLSLQLDDTASKAYQDALAKRGVTQYYSTGVKEVFTDENNCVKELELSNGKRIPCDLLVVASGVRANISFLQDTEVSCDKFGLIFDDTGKTNMDTIYGAGDVSGRNPIWPSAVKEGIIAASNMCGVPTKMTDFFASKSTMNFLGILSMSVGMVKPEDDTYQVVTEQDEKGNYKKIVHKDGKICGAIIQGDLSYVGILTQLIKEEIDISRVKKSLFKIDYSDFFHIDSKYEFRYED